MNVENMKILSVDDNKTNLLIIESYAKILNLKIESFLNPIEALKTSFQNNYDLVIVDYMMPELNGLDFIKEFREKNQNTPIIMLTAVGDDMQLQIKALIGKFGHFFQHLRRKTIIIIHIFSPIVLFRWIFF